MPAQKRECVLAPDVAGIDVLDNRLRLAHSSRIQPTQLSIAPGITNSILARQWMIGKSGVFEFASDSVF